VTGVSAVFSEPLNAALVNGATFRLFAAGPDGLTGTADDVLVAGAFVAYRGQTNTVVMTFGAPLPLDSYRALISGAFTDLAGNALGDDYSWTFRISRFSTIDFEDQPDFIHHSPPFPTVYRGITWTGWRQADAPSINLQPGGINAIFATTDGARFGFSERVFVGASFSRLAGSDGDVYFELYRNGTLLWTSQAQNSATPTLTFYASGYGGLVDEVRVRSLGVPIFSWIMDNLVFEYPLQ
jgi:hypothetical protein